MAGVCCAITAARQGLLVVLVQDRPVLGGNASSEVRLWILGATSHMGNNNRWAREGGVIDEILVENMYRNREGNPCIFDALVLEKVTAEPNIRLLLNTAVYEVEKSGENIDSVTAFCSQNQTSYKIVAPLFCDASGDGVVAFQAGAAFRMGAESRTEFGEGFAPETERHELLGHSIYFYTRDTGQPVRFVAPAFALKDITKIPRYRSIRAEHNGCNFWWLEYGGELDTIRDSEKIKWELWKIVYGVWDHIKNSGEFPQAETLTLEWVGMIPGKRESRRFEGDYMLTQRDIVEQRQHNDAVSHGGWAIDLHPKEGVYSAESPCIQWHSKGIYSIPYRCYYSKNVSNLFLAGRIISASHVAFGSTRVMATCAAGGQAVAVAAVLCLRHNLKPRDITAPARMQELQQALIHSGQFIPSAALQDESDLVQHAKISASSTLRLSSFPADAAPLSLDSSWAMMLPVTAGQMPSVAFTLDVSRPATLHVQLRASSRPDNHTPDVILETRDIQLPSGDKQHVPVEFASSLKQDCYAFVVLLANPDVAVRRSTHRVTGVLAVAHRCNAAVAKSATQSPPEGIGIDTFEFWTPERRPGGQNLGLDVEPPLQVFSTEALRDGVDRPTDRPHAWAAELTDPSPGVTLQWPDEQNIARVLLSFDTDFDHPMESLLLGHPEDTMPFCVRRFCIRGDDGQLLYQCADNHQTRREIAFPQPVRTSKLVLELSHPAPNIPAALFGIRAYSR
jgi:hypothetical protein